MFCIHYTVVFSFVLVFSQMCVPFKFKSCVKIKITVFPWNRQESVSVHQPSISKFPAVVGEETAETLDQNQQAERQAFSIMESGYSASIPSLRPPPLTLGYRRCPRVHSSQLQNSRHQYSLGLLLCIYLILSILSIYLIWL